MKRGHAHKNFIRIQRIDKPVKEFDETPAKWEDHLPEPGTTVASVTPTRAGEFVEGEQVSERITHKVELRWVAGVKSSMRVLLDDEAISSDNDHKDKPDKRVLEIDSTINVKERNRDLVLLCVEKV